MDQSILNMLKDDHKAVAAHLNKLMEAEDKDLLEHTNELLETHLQFEENNLYPRLAEYEETKDFIPKARDQHNQAREAVKELKESGGGEWNAAVQNVIVLIMEHVEMEENEMFPKAEEVLSEAELEALGTKYQEEK